MSISRPVKMCECLDVNGSHPSHPGHESGHGTTPRVRADQQVGPALARWLSLLLVSGSFTFAQPTNNEAGTNAPLAHVPAEAAPAASSSTSRSHGLDDSAFRIIAERNIFNANRSGGQVRLPSRRPSRVESFTLVGTMAYEKGAFAFFAGSSSELSKPVQSGGVIAGHKIADVLANGVKLEADGKIFELPVGSTMRREDEGTWQLSDGVTSSDGSATASVASASSRSSDASSRSSRSDSSSRFSRSDSGSRSSRSDGSRSSGSESRSASAPAPVAAPATPAAADSNADESEILKRLMERRERESQ